jgi:hypothetical protein
MSAEPQRTCPSVHSVVAPNESGAEPTTADGLQRSGQNALENQGRIWIGLALAGGVRLTDDSLVLTWARIGYLPHNLVEIEARGFLSRREFFEALKPLRDQRYSPVVQVNMVYEPLIIQEG